MGRQRIRPIDDQAEEEGLSCDVLPSYGDLQFADVLLHDWIYQNWSVFVHNSSQQCTLSVYESMCVSPPQVSPALDVYLSGYSRILVGFVRTCDDHKS